MEARTEAEQDIRIIQAMRRVKDYPGLRMSLRLTKDISLESIHLLYSGTTFKPRGRKGYAILTKAALSMALQIYFVYGIILGKKFIMTRWYFKFFELKSFYGYQTLNQMKYNNILERKKGHGYKWYFTKEFKVRAEQYMEYQDSMLIGILKRSFAVLEEWEKHQLLKSKRAKENEIIRKRNEKHPTTPPSYSTLRQGG